MNRLWSVIVCVGIAGLFAAGCRSEKTGSTTGQVGAQRGDTPDAQLVVATINGEKITLGEVNRMVKGQLLSLEKQRLEQEHKIRQDGLEGMIAKKLVLAEAARRKVTEAELLRAEVEAKTTAPTATELKAFYDRNAQQIGAPFEQVKDRLGPYLVREKQQQAFMAFLGQLRSTAKVETTLPPAELPYVEVAAVGPSRGPADAPVTIVIFSDFQCPFCSKTKPILDQIASTYGSKVRMVFRDYPLPFHQFAAKASEAGHCADQQGKFWEMHDQMFAHQDKLGVDDLKAHARQLGLDGAKFDACLDSSQTQAKVAENYAAGQEAGVDGTPAFFINGRMLSGAQTFDAFKRLIDRELSRRGV